MVLKLYYNSSEEDVTKISIDLKNEAKSIASFDVSRIDNDNWIGPTRNMQFKIIQIYDDTTLKFEGLITTISPQKTLLHCECEDICSILANNVQIQSKIGGTDFIRYEGKIGVVSDEIISVGTSDGELLGMVDDEVIGKYIIISDANIGDTTVALFNTDKTYIGFGQVTSNLQYISGQEYTDVDENPNSSMGDPWTLWKDDEHLTGYGGIQLSVVNHSISSTSTLKQMIVDIGFDIELPLSGIFGNANVYFDVIMKRSNTPTDGVLLWRSPTYTQKVLAAVTASHSLNITVNIAGMPALDTQLFTKDVLWETSYIFIKIVSTESICEAIVKWKYVGIDLTYTDTAYSQTNDEITDNTTVFINAKDSNDVAINFTERGVSAGDSFCIAESVPHVYDLVGNGSLGIKFLYGKNYPEDIKKGFGKCLNGVNSFELWQEITSYMDHTWYVDYRIDVSPILVAKDRTALESETADLTGFASYNIIIEDQEYSEVIIFGTGGDVVSVPTTSTTSIIPYKEIRKDYISLTELTEYATKLATKFSDPAYSIELIYNGFKDVQVGYSVASITIPNDYGDDSVYTNQIVRRVVYEQDTINSLIITKVYLGRGMTPIDEKVGNILGTLKKRLDRNDAISSSRLYVPATAVQHSDLSGILPSTASQYHFTSTQYTKVVSMLSGTFKAANIQKYSALSNSPRVYDGLDFMGSDDATRQKLYNLANGTDQYDGVNFGQLDAVKTTADAAVSEFFSFINYCYNGFIAPQAYYGAILAYVPNNDSAADIEGCIVVTNAGTYKLRIRFNRNDTNAQTVALTLRARNKRTTAAGSWDINDSLNGTFSGVNGGTAYLDSTSTITVKAGDIVGIHFTKGASVNTSNNMYIDAISLVRQ
jgi:hypothetical protein